MEWSLDVLRAAGCDPVVIVVPAGSPSKIESNGSVRAVGGGDTRQRSVRNGLREIEASTVVIHDAVRPFVTIAMVERVLAALSDFDGAIVASRSDEALKEVDGGRVVRTLDRSRVWRAQTPQAFRTDAIVDAHRRAESEGIEASDDAELLEHYGGRIAVVEVASRNLKVTYPEDFALAESLLRLR